MNHCQNEIGALYIKEISVFCTGYICKIRQNEFDLNIPEFFISIKALLLTQCLPVWKSKSNKIYGISCIKTVKKAFAYHQNSINILNTVW